MKQYHFESLEVWKRGMELVKKVYKLTQKFPEEEIYGLTGQMRRAAVSIPANIAEGKGRGHDKEYSQFLHVTRGSVFEEITLIKVAYEPVYLKEVETEELLNLCNEVSTMLKGLIDSLK